MTIPIDLAHNNNFSHGRASSIKGFVIHIMSGTYEGTRSWFKNPISRASAHYIVAKDGRITQMVRDTDTAFANGLRWALGVPINPRGILLNRTRLGVLVQQNTGVNPNAYTISIEHEGKSGEPWTDAMYNTTAELLKELSAKYNITLNQNTVIGHRDIDYIDRPSCPGVGVSLEKLISLANLPIEEPDMYRIFSFTFPHTCKFRDGADLNIYQEPNKQSAVIGRAQPGDVFYATQGTVGEVLDEVGQWYRCGEGWVSERFITVLPPTSTPTDGQLEKVKSEVSKGVQLISEAIK